MREILATLARIACERATHESTADQLAYLGDCADAYVMAGELA
jgi:hypothetical protein